MNKKFKKGVDDNLLNSLAESALKAADKFNKIVNDLDKIKKVLQGKPPNKRFEKKVVSASDMKLTTLYKGLSDGLLYRRLNDRIEKMVGAGKWVEVKVSYDFLNNEKFREY